ncbi:hypothetical protein [Desulfosporosinus lacus]|uniref:Uncharacterized protein n=1 Tax=Desulfosporosinus lacus DSM 15449 TaxID=1121420 RepID=A0A1M5WID3_9FIRM|nr:hypothetical protein [Desulfosporosinus lacus]SHH87256.1 hypothetical protein SAMN02746098_01632 [Desulfosporosinus lacus DSM 15449]
MNDFDSFLENVEQDLGSLTEINKPTYYFEEYQQVLFSDSSIVNRKLLYLVGSKAVTQPKSIAFNKSELLIDLINLGMEFEKKYGQNDEFAYANEIINFCKKYGHPFESEYFRKNAYKDKNGEFQNIHNYIDLSGRKPPTGYSAFEVREFRRHVFMLYDTFQLWYGLFFDDLRRVIKYSHDHSFTIDASNIDEKIRTLKELLPFKLLKLSVFLKYNEKNDSYYIEPHAGNIFEVAKFQFAMLVLGKSEKGVKFCTTCGNPFEFTHGNTKNCPKCVNEYQKNLMRKRRAEKKGGR